jgi:hypothetical protein
VLPVRTRSALPLALMLLIRCAAGRRRPSRCRKSRWHAPGFSSCWRPSAASRRRAASSCSGGLDARPAAQAASRSGVEPLELPAPRGRRCWPARGLGATTWRSPPNWSIRWERWLRPLAEPSAEPRRCSRGRPKRGAGPRKHRLIGAGKARPAEGAGPAAGASPPRIPCFVAPTRLRAWSGAAPALSCAMASR